jgi:hypothetical protein
MLLRMTTKDLNKFVVAMLKKLDSVDPRVAGDALATYLAEQTAEARVWPSDARMREQLPNMRMYGALRQDRLRVVLAAVEQRLRSQGSKYEPVPLPSGLEIEHVMPQSWRTHWDPEPRLDSDAAAERDRLVNALGNLTLVTKSLNGSLSNRPWTDAQAAGLTQGGAPGKGKSTLLNEFSLLVLNRAILVAHADAWTEEDIRRRSDMLVSVICEVWPGPARDVQSAAFERQHGRPDRE